VGDKGELKVLGHGPGARAATASRPTTPARRSCAIRIGRLVEVDDKY